jgi:hypothetical protein
MPKRHIPSCLGHADERTSDVRCTRCDRQLWTLIRPASAEVSKWRPDTVAYLCQRCRAALAGRNVIDPMVTDARRAQLTQARNRPDQEIQQAKTGGISLGSESPVVPAPPLRVHPGVPAQPVTGLDPTIPRQTDGNSLTPSPGTRRA